MLVWMMSHLSQCGGKQLEIMIDLDVTNTTVLLPDLTVSRYATRSLRFMDAYRKGLNGKQVAWAAKKYRGHRMIPDTILQDLEKATVK